MMNTRLCKVWSELHLPADLWREILTRLPVKSILRFRCVSRSWLSLIDDADFARLHLNNFKNNRDETHLLVVQGRQRKCVVRCSDTFETNSETLHTLGKEEFFYPSWDIVCCVDGLILLKIYTRSDRFSVLKVWNPSIRKFRKLPSLPEIETSPDSFMADDDIGLGYDPLANDYKHVKLIFGNYNTLHSVAIYSLGGGSWKTIKFQVKGSSCSNWRWQRQPSYYNRRVYFEGSLYFIARDAHNCSVCDLVSFDLSSEVFSSISVPDYPDFRCTEPALIDGGRSLAVVDRFSLHKSVWVLEGCSAESESLYWTKRCSFHLKYTGFLYLKKDGNILTRRCRGEKLRLETGKRKMVRWDQVELYSPETNEYKFLQQKRASQYMISHCSDTFETNSETFVTLGRDNNGRHTEEIWDFVCSLDGLVVLMGAARSGRFRALKVWNPSIRKFHEFPSFLEFETSPDGSLYDIDIGLGYDLLAKDYKHVKLIFLNYKTLPSVAIYSLGGGSWKIIKFQGKGSSCSKWHWGCGPLNMSVYFQGSLYFIAEDAHNHLVWDLVSFDLSNEVFSFVSMPDDPYFKSNDFRGWSKLVLIDGGCSLAVVDTISRDKSVWVLESSSGGSESLYWTKGCLFPSRVVQFLYLKKNGDMLTRMCRVKTLTITSETGKNDFVRLEQVTSYNPETDEYKIMQQKRGFYMISHVCGYVESLIMHK